MSLNHRHCHDVEDAASVHVFGVGQFIEASALVIGGLNLAVDLAAIRTFKKYAILAMGGDGGADGRVGGLFLRYLFDVEGFLVGDVELGANLVNHVLNGDFLGRWASAWLAMARFQLH